MPATGDLLVCIKIRSLPKVKWDKVNAKQLPKHLTVGLKYGEFICTNINWYIYPAGLLNAQKYKWWFTVWHSIYAYVSFTWCYCMCHRFYSKPMLHKIEYSHCKARATFGCTAVVITMVMHIIVWHDALKYVEAVIGMHWRYHGLCICRSQDTVVITANPVAKNAVAVTTPIDASENTHIRSCTRCSGFFLLVVMRSWPFSAAVTMMVAKTTATLLSWPQQCIRVWQWLNCDGCC